MPHIRLAEPFSRGKLPFLADHCLLWQIHFGSWAIARRAPQRAAAA
jgi:hypothetical protein